MSIDSYYSGSATDAARSLISGKSASDYLQESRQL